MLPPMIADAAGLEMRDTYLGERSVASRTERSPRTGFVWMAGKTMVKV